MAGPLNIGKPEGLYPVFRVPGEVDLPPYYEPFPDDGNTGDLLEKWLDRLDELPEGSGAHTNALDVIHDLRADLASERENGIGGGLLDGRLD